MQQEIFYTTTEVARLLKVERTTLYRWRKAGKLKAKKINGLIRYRVTDIKKLSK